MFNRRINIGAFSLVGTLAALLEAGGGTLRGLDIGEQRTSRKGLRQIKQRTHYSGGTRHIDKQNGASLRRRMGGNARRIREAREGRVWDDAARQYVPSTRVLYEEVEALHLKAVRSQPSPRHWGNWFPCNGGYYTATIRGMLTKIAPRFCGPIGFRQVDPSAER